MTFPMRNDMFYLIIRLTEVELTTGSIRIAAPTVWAVIAWSVRRSFFGLQEIINITTEKEKTHGNVIDRKRASG